MPKNRTARKRPGCSADGVEADDVQAHVVDDPVLDAAPELAAVRLVERRGEDGPEAAVASGLDRRRRGRR